MKCCSLASGSHPGYTGSTATSSVRMLYDLLPYAMFAVSAALGFTLQGLLRPRRRPRD